MLDAMTPDKDNAYRLVSALFLRLLGIIYLIAFVSITPQVEGLAGSAFIAIGILALIQGEAFLAPLFNKGQFGELVSSGSLPLLYLAVGLKVGSELASLLSRLASDDEAAP